MSSVTDTTSSDTSSSTTLVTTTSSTDSTTTPTNSVLGPLTTAWTYPSSCTVNVHNCLTCLQVLQGQTCTTALARGYMGNTECWPPRSGSSIPTATSGWGVYSPGIECPVGYVSACAATGSAVTGNAFSFRFSLSAAETAIGCCPSGYACSNVDYQTCVRLASTGSIPVVTCTSDSSNGFSYLPLPTTITDEIATDSTTTVTMSTATLLAPLFQLVYQASDIAANTSTAVVETETPEPSTSSGGLSTGARAGIAVGVVVAVLVIVGSAGFVWWHKRKQAKASVPVEVSGENAYKKVDPIELSTASPAFEMSTETSSQLLETPQTQHASPRAVYEIG